jgi:soluble lytic murein transglycosylase-like protein
MMRRLIATACFVLISGSAYADSYYRGMVFAEAARTGVPPTIAVAVVRVESNFNPRARGRAGEWGLMQIKCQTARGVGFSGRCAALADPQTNVTYGMRYLALALKRGGPGCAGVSLYQSGIYARPRCSPYGRRVMAMIGG